MVASQEESTPVASQEESNVPILGGLVDQAGGVYSCCYSPSHRRRDPRLFSYFIIGHT